MVSAPRNTFHVCRGVWQLKLPVPSGVREVQLSCDVSVLPLEWRPRALVLMEVRWILFVSQALLAGWHMRDDNESSHEP